MDPTDLIIADGLTGVVGPNGCGKSNLLEALRWVMGENRPTAMRGGGMEDVIFAGAATRPARNFAEVSLHIDNGERLAPAAFNDSDQLDVVRRITRDIGSAYKANSKEVRARDVQMLFADASTGAHSPALVRQGQISELINAKPKSRRRILEEAAGISGLYARRHEAELKLRGAETNLARVDDVIEQLANQLATLARQAKQASRYRELGSALRLAEGLMLYQRWKDAEDAVLATQSALQAASLAASQAEAAQRKAETGRITADDALPALREGEAISNAVLQRLMVQRDSLTDQEKRAAETIQTLTARSEQLRHDIGREGELNSDATETIDRLQVEAAELSAAGEGHEATLYEAAEKAHEARQILTKREAELSEITEKVARLAARHQSVQRFVQESDNRVTRARSEETKARETADQAKAAISTASESLVTAQEDEAQAKSTVALADETLAQAEAARAACQAEEADARTLRSEAAGTASALTAEVSALEKLVARNAGDGQQLLSDIQMEPGFEKALGAALADDLKAPMIAGDGVTGWAQLPGYGRDQALPAGCRPLAEVADVPAVLARRLAQIGIVDPARARLLQAELLPGQRLVSTNGDLWRWDGFRSAAADAPSAAALQLEQRNRLAALQKQLRTAQDAANSAQSNHQAIADRLGMLTKADQDARAARRETDRLMADAARALSRAEADKNLAEGRLETSAHALSRLADELAEAQRQQSEAQSAQADLGDLDEARAEVEDVKMTVEAARMAMMSRRSAHDEIKREGEQREKRAAQVARDITNWENRLKNAATRGAELAQRLDKASAELKAARAVPAGLEEERTKLARSLEEAKQRRKTASDALAEGENRQRAAVQAERDAIEAAANTREARARAEARHEAATEARQAAEERIAEEAETTPQELLESLDVDPAEMPDMDAIENDVARLRRQRDALGAVNLRAEEDAREVQEEHDTLATEKADLEEAIGTLRSGIASLNKEGRQRLLDAFEEVNQNFGTLFTHLFGGGEANLVLVESDDPLEAGLEIMCQPPGKKLSTLSLLSGGEQTLTALALIFAVFLANPAPICVLDEVDAPLDDANVTRFCDLLDEMTRRTNTRFLIITHHAVTMARMDRLFGVTMAEQGVSQLVSVDLNKAEQMVA